MHVVGGDHGQVQTARQFGHARDVLLLFGQPVRLDLEVEVSRTEDLPVLTGSVLRRGQIAAQDRLGDLALQAARQRDEPAAVARQGVLVDAGLVVESVQVREGGELDEVAVALKIGRQQDEMKGVGVEFWITAQKRPGGHVGLHADDRVEPGFFRPQVELDHAVHRPVVSDGHGRHLQLLGPGDEGRDSAMTVEEAVLGVQVEVDELTHAQKTLR